MSGFSSINGRLFGVGLGPGDPDLVTIKATKIIAAVPVAAYFAKKGASGKAHAILDRWVTDTCLQLPLLYPVTTETHFCDPAYTQELRAFYTTAEDAITTHLLAGRDVALVCEGDPLFYGS
ncbi:MAG: SAM-dependent methyltransferase, partial [Methylocella sp.]